MTAVSAPPPLPTGPVVTCPYTAGGCPLFQTIDVSASSRCAGSCSPAPAPARSPRATPSTTAATSSSSKRPAPSAYTYDDALLLSELTGDIGLPLPSALLKQDSWAGYLDFGISPEQLEMPFLGAVAGPSGFTPAAAKLPSPPPPPKNQLWDLEDLIPAGQDNKRVRTTPPPVGHPGAAAAPVEYPSVDLPAVEREQAQVSTTASPLGSDEETEVVTPFISKLSYLLQHHEYEPWVRWDTTGQYLLVAHTKPHLLHILERFFRHTVTSSFIRQLNIYGFKRASTAQLLNILDATPFSASVTLPDGTLETFSASDFSAFVNPLFFRSPGAGGAQCRLGALKPITKERGPRNRSKKTQAAAQAQREAKKAGAYDPGREGKKRMRRRKGGGGGGGAP
ncbi:hypothetical protein JCM3770_003083 [Rhodotorula araucariae]